MTDDTDGLIDSREQMTVRVIRLMNRIKERIDETPSVLWDTQVRHAIRQALIEAQYDAASRAITQSKRIIQEALADEGKST